MELPEGHLWHRTIIIQKRLINAHSRQRYSLKSIQTYATLLTGYRPITKRAFCELPSTELALTV
jgi:hypothetical protein